MPRKGLGILLYIIEGDLIKRTAAFDGYPGMEPKLKAG
jgi:hypothetical protein